MIKAVSVLSRTSVFLPAAALLLAFMLFVFPVMGALLDAHTPAGGDFDTVFFYTPAQALHKASLFAPEDVPAFVMIHWTYDLAFPLAYGFFAASAWAFGIRLLASRGRTVRSVRSVREPDLIKIALPLAAVAFDLCENAAVTVLLASLTGRDSGSIVVRAAATAASVFTLLKWLSVIPALTGAFLLPAAGLAALARRKG